MATRTEGSGKFREAARQIADPKERAHLLGLADWADDLERQGCCRVYTGDGVKGITLIPVLTTKNRLMVKFEDGKAWLQMTVVGDNAPDAASEVERISGVTIASEKGFADTNSKELRVALADAYCEAARR